MALSSQQLEDSEEGSLVAVGAAGGGRAATTALSNLNDDCKVSPSLSTSLQKEQELTSVERFVRVFCCRVSRFFLLSKGNEAV